VRGVDRPALLAPPPRAGATPPRGRGGPPPFGGGGRTTDGGGVDTGGAQRDGGPAEQVRASLEAQHANVSGVSIDEETINLISFQQQYQAAARLISTVDELTQILISLV